MDNLCHTLVGAAMGRAGLGRRSRWGAAALMISANLPDIDVAVFATATPAVAFRRGWTHGIAAQVALPLLLTALLWLLARRSRGSDRSPPFHAGWILLLSYAGVGSHVFLDYLNNYGVRLLAPLEWRWFYGDAVFIVDVWLWVVLGAGVWRARRGRTTAAPRYALAAAGIYVIAMLASARAARAIVHERWTDAHGVPPRALMVGPRPITPLERDVIVDAGGYYERGSFSWRSGLTLGDERIPKNDERPEVRAAREDAAIRGFLVWSRFPFWTLEAVEGGTRVSVMDVRFMARGGTFSASIIVPVESHASDQGAAIGRPRSHR